MLPVPHLEVNPRGLIHNILWQMDVTHVPEFEKLKFLHVFVDTFSGFVLSTKNKLVDTVYSASLYTEKQ